ncbi:GNAT family N-acetyltransferase [Inhella sp.]|uniref:GNAT family N-acetyltransferase n=1 Tax=Inhella sp. TaxID=1921806 RepID=UPI0035B40FF3
MLSLHPPTFDDHEELHDFEHGNRTFFGRHINARPAEYYAPGGVRAAIEAALQDAAQDKAYQFLARDAAGRLVARVNLHRVRREHFHCAELGYRVAESQGGKGYAGEAVRLVLLQAFGPLRLLRVEANSRPDNLASIAVLRRNGFAQYGRSSRSFELSGQWHDICHFERHADAGAAQKS